jgi:hypothetical protein
MDGSLAGRLAGACLDDARLLDAWERGRTQPPGTRAVLLLGSALPDLTTEELARLPFGRRNALLLVLRAGCLGDELAGITSCPHCGDALEVRLTPAALGIEPRPAADSPVHRLVHDGYEAVFRLPATADLAGLDAGGDRDMLARTTVERCLVDVRKNGEGKSPAELPPALLEAIALEMSRLDPHADIALALDCAACGRRWEQPLDVAEFVWTEMAARARRLLTDVARLAIAFGWSEADILALPARRRHSYLELLEA